MKTGHGFSLAVMILAFAGWMTPAVAQEESVDKAIEVLRQGIPHDALYALEMSGEWGLAVGAFGLMLETRDGGATWNTLEPVTKLSLLGIAHAGDHRIVVGQQGVVLTQAGDEGWKVVDSGFEQRMLNVAMNGSGMAVTVGEFGFIAVSRDRGATWRPMTIVWDSFNDEGYEPHLYDAHVTPDGTIMIAGEFGLILRSVDGGATFVDVNRADESVFDLYIARDGSNTGYAVGQEGLVVKTTDGGETWQRLTVASKANLLGVWAGNGDVVITGIREMLRSSDDGATFTRTNDFSIARTWFQGVSAGVAEKKSGDSGFLRQQSVYIAGHRATIARVIK